MNNPPLDDCPLYVDLDGSLTPSDTLHESVVLFARRHPMNLLRMVVWLPRGKAGFKRALADAVLPEPEQLPWRTDFIDFLRHEHARGRTLVLATAADVRIARRVADHLGVFSDVLATGDGGPNLSRANKREAIAAHARLLGHERWAYAGNSADDLHVWAGSAQAVAVNTPAGVLRRLQSTHAPAQVFEHRPLTLKTVLRAIRLKQWSKNGLLFVPLLAAHATSPALWFTLFMAFVAFGLCASATYLVNDLLDLPNDRAHRLKRFRPLAAGTMGIASAVAIGAVMILAAFALALWVGGAFTAALLVYTALTLGYSLRWKRIPLIDVLLLATLYTLRIGAGALAAHVDLSNWLLAISIFLFLSLALVKRCAELEEAVEAHHAPAPGRGYHPRDLATLRTMGMTSGFMSVLVLTLYIDSPNSRALYGQPDWLWAAAPVLLLWVMRIWFKTGRRELYGEDPLAFALKDPFSWATLLIMGGIGVAATIGWQPHL
ncbi:MAG: UbiA family prenyltransferase [Hydrogenophaga sp.]|uniref:UbiA family prenyltransferase n=1 Tax=Hydrogenophaga sp. TaxID=1904254 RepID=UPI0016AC832F|nr:UbiA family prenyltransferase [Hydrogenophaga sp.]NIM39939.1 UbiA family prenyltransferase [Hydrogenophaga sp.]NIN25135.1 UbiA family prenyltransferase [Hydrogenophaga sp.]NIN29702.1 UbiA family prenyltransferase [Hydrogenophaga sp.]NIN54174.1 UbiA family prenyltransferase [Hydrogenophaga sp.]NIO50587.1 UbiA family prenyltransferase [Hydrogenophaga sp.]